MDHHLPGGDLGGEAGYDAGVNLIHIRLGSPPYPIQGVTAPVVVDRSPRVDQMKPIWLGAEKFGAEITLENTYLGARPAMGKGAYNRVPVLARHDFGRAFFGSYFLGGPAAAIFRNAASNAA